MSPIFALYSIDRLKPGHVLDIGARDCRIARRLSDEGCTVDAIDPLPRPDVDLGSAITYHQTTLEDFEADRLYDLVVASMVSQLVNYETPDYLCRLKAFARADGLVYVTLIGNEDGWADNPRAKAISFDEACGMIADVGLRPVFRAEERFDGRVYSGEAKFWHLLRFVLECESLAS